MKQTIIALAIFAASGVHATGHPPPPSNPAPNASSSAQAGAVAGAAAVAGVKNRVSVRNTAAGGAGGSATITGLTGIAGGQFGGAGGAVGNVMAGGLELAGARIGSDVKVERSAPSLYGATPTQPTQPCARPGFSIGGSGRDGSGLLSIPTGTDVTCRVDNALTIMARNSKLFSDDDRLTVSCKQEDIAETQTCKDLARRKASAERAAAVLEDRHTRAYIAARDSSLLP
ncbi:hypothetical protein C7T35_01220 [Variovorax sp. WS11]|uniref:hypothetical protein n=1 Tax=Variovorax sp. WS11 TaxID=1105204 RepID=UPI000D0E203B|nr:hypothetical protein [Variovorax sp. WS11]NDZ11529.1 hypothetical protein [Variovorax sp. WS11]PSL86617.1 hypothetical protein C7T35_01220 [Variovorax sp. WS11]